MVCDLLVLLLWLWLDTQREKWLNECIINAFCSARSRFLVECAHPGLNLFWKSKQYCISPVLLRISNPAVAEKLFCPSYFVLKRRKSCFLFFTSATVFVPTKRGFPRLRLILFSPVQLKSCFLTDGFREMYKNPICTGRWECCCLFGAFSS